MSSRSSAPTLELALTPSLRAIQWLLALHVGAISLTFAASPPKWAGLLLAALFLISWLRLRGHPAFGYGPTALTRLSALGDGSWRIQIAEGQSIEAQLLGGSVVWPTLLVLGFRGEDQCTRHRLIVGDEIDPDSLRRLRARLLNRPTSD